MIAISAVSQWTPASAGKTISSLCQSLCGYICRWKQTSHLT